MNSLCPRLPYLSLYDSDSMTSIDLRLTPLIIQFSCSGCYHALVSTENFYVWFKSYLLNRTQFIKINGTSSATQPLDCGVPQGSILRPLVISYAVMDYRCFYIQTTHMCMLLLAACQDSEELSLVKHCLEICMSDVNNWMTFNKLKLNTEKTELLVLHCL